MANKCPSGKVRREGRCVIRKSSSYSRKKSYNPFKMWGAWVGAVIGGITPIFNSKGKIIEQITNSGKVVCDASGINCIDISRPNIILLIFGFVIFIILGFLLGYLIHALIRKFGR